MSKLLQTLTYSLTYKSALTHTRAALTESGQLRSQAVCFQPPAHLNFFGLNEKVRHQMCLQALILFQY